MSKPDLNNVPEYFHKYIALIKEDDLPEALKNQTKSFIQLLNRIPKKKRDYRYAEGKWSIKEMVQHVIDTERVFAYRALCISRQDKTPLPSMDENEYAKNVNVNERKWKDMVHEFTAMRLSTIFLFESFNNEQLTSVGQVVDNSISVEGLGFIIAGHAQHHTLQIQKHIIKLKKWLKWVKQSEKLLKKMPKV